MKSMHILLISMLPYPTGRFALVLAVLLAVLVIVPTAHAQHQHPAQGSTVTPPGGFGTIVFENSGSREAQEPFLRGVALMHSFEDAAAREAFQQAQQSDPGFALAYWGEAMTSADTAKARAALVKLDPTPQGRLARARTPRERMYLAAAETLFVSSAPDSVRFDRYRSLMRVLHEAYPDDDEATMFYARSFLADAYNTDLPERELLSRRVEGAALAEGVFSRNPNHPGAAHYLIHFYDNPSLAPLGMRAARAYAAIAPRSSHAQHMPSHIFARYGLWDEMVASNQKANQAARELASTRTNALLLEHYSFHALDWLTYAFVQQGRLRDAKAVTDTVRQVITLETVAQMPDTRRSVYAYVLANQQTFYAVASGALDYPIRVSWPWGSFKGPYASEFKAQEGMIWTRLEVERATRRRDAAALHELAASVASLADTLTLAGAAAGSQEDGRKQLGRLSKSIQARAEMVRGNTQQATELLRSVIAEEEQELGEGEAAMAFFKPSRELLAELLLTSGKAEEALREYHVLNNQYRGYWSAMLGRARTLAVLGRTEEAREAYARLLQNWKQADSDHPYLAEVKAGATGNFQQTGSR